MAANPFNNPGKRVVREQWNTPLLRHLNCLHGMRYRYLGLPGIEALDLKLWQDMIDEVIAFEVPARPTRRDPDGRRNIKELRRQLLLLGTQSNAYYGPMEEVIIRRRDYDGAEYQQERLVTLYNLDFCDEISSSIETLDADRQVWRFEAIRQILLDQAYCFRIEQLPRYFIILLTIRNQIGASKLRDYFTSPLAESSAYWQHCDQVSPLPASGPLIGTHTWALKTFIYDQLRQWLGGTNISSLFFPVVKYEGTPVKAGGPEAVPSPMLHLMVLCRFGDVQRPSPPAYPKDFLTSTDSVRVHDDGTLAWEPEPGEPSNAAESPDPTKWFDAHVGSLMLDASTGQAIPLP